MSRLDMITQPGAVIDLRISDRYGVVQPGIDYGRSFDIVDKKTLSGGKTLYLLHKKSCSVWGGRMSRRLTANAIYALVESSVGGKYLVIDSGEVGTDGTWREIKSRITKAYHSRS